MSDDHDPLVYQGKSLDEWQLRLTEGNPEEVQAAALALREMSQQLSRAFGSLARASLRDEAGILDAALIDRENLDSNERNQILDGLLQQVRFENREIAALALEALLMLDVGQTGDTQRPSNHVCLVRLLKDKRNEVRQLAIDVIAKRGSLDSRGTRALVSLFRHRSAEVRTAALEAACGLNALPASSVPDVARSLQSDDSEEVWHALSAMARAQSLTEQALIGYLKPIKDELGPDNFDYESHQKALCMLGEIGKVSDSTVEFVLHLSDLGETWVQALENIDRARGLHPYRDQALGLLVQNMTSMVQRDSGFLFYPNEELSLACGLALLSLEPSEVAESLIDPGERSATGGVLRGLVSEGYEIEWIINTLAKATLRSFPQKLSTLASVLVDELELTGPNDLGLELFAPMLKDTQPEMRVFAIEALRATCNIQGCRELKKLTNDPDDCVRQAVQCALDLLSFEDKD